jgi:hypothetical protein
VNGSLCEPSWLWSHSSCFYNYRCNQYLSPLMLWARISIRARCTTLCNKVCQWLAKVWWFFPGPPVSSTNKGGCHDIAEILLKVALTTITQTKKNNMCDEEKITDITVFSNDRSKQFHVSPLLFSLFVIRMSNTDEHTSNCFLWNANRYLNPVFSKHTESMEYHYNLHLLIPHVRPSYHII